MSGGQLVLPELLFLNVVHEAVAHHPVLMCVCVCSLSPHIGTAPASPPLGERLQIWAVPESLAMAAL